MKVAIAEEVVTTKRVVITLEPKQAVALANILYCVIWDDATLEADLAEALCLALGEEGCGNEDDIGDRVAPDKDGDGKAALSFMPSDEDA